MSTKIKVRNMRIEYRYSFLWNLLIVFLVLAANNFILPFSGVIGNRTMTSMYILDGAATLFLMYWLEKYTVTISGLYENNVITVLANFYCFIAVSFINLVFFRSAEKFFMDLCIMAEKIIAMFITDYLLYKARNNPKRYKKPRLLILDSLNKNFYRMKRIKYGVLKNYDSWYENIGGLSIDEVRQFIDEEFKKYDAICVLDGLNADEYAAAVQKTMDLNIDLFVVPKIIDVGKTNARIVRFDDVLTLYMPKKLMSPADQCIKRIFDILLSIIGLAIAAVPMLLIAAAIKLTSPGPVFYKQLRLTKGKKEFTIYKFRTMIPDAEKLSGPKFAEKNDPRITPIGKILRASRLDELPQILNILRGDMSVVGPRPERPVFVEQFNKEIENYDYRFEVRAGLTSLSHVYGRYSTYIHDRTYYDLFYITHYSLLLDLKIILLTTKTMLLKSAAEGEDEFKVKTTGKSGGESD